MEYTYLYYGYYSNNNAGRYQMAVAYFFVMFCCFLQRLSECINTAISTIYNVTRSNTICLYMLIQSGR